MAGTRGVISKTVITYPGHGATGASVIDSCVVQDRRNGRLVVLIDHFPGGIGQPNAEADLGVDEKGRYILHDAEGATYTWMEDGAVTDAHGHETPFKVSERGDVTVTEDGEEQPGGNVFLADGEDPNQTLLTKRTCYLQMVYSDDDGGDLGGSFQPEPGREGRVDVLLRDLPGHGRAAAQRTPRDPDLLQRRPQASLLRVRRLF